MDTPTCPKCGGHEFEMPVLQTVRVFFSDFGHDITEQPSGDIEWDDNTSAQCHDCGHEAPLGKMVKP